MNAEIMLDMLASNGIRLLRNGANIDADIAEGADITPHLDMIREHKGALLAALDLRARIIAAATIDPARFNRDEYNRLWACWNALNTNATDEDAA